MDWKKMDARALAAVLQKALDESPYILDNCFHKPEKRIQTVLDRIKVEVQYLRTSEDQISAVYSSNAKELLYKLFGEYRKALYLLSRTAQIPFTADMLIDSDIAEMETIELLDMKVDGIYLFRDGENLMLRTPPLPHKNKPKVYLGGSHKGYITSTRVYSEAVYRAFWNCRAELADVFKGLQYKTIHILNVFDDPSIVPDNDNRDTYAIINSICAFLPSGDSPDSTRILYDGYVSDEIFPGTYITVMPYEKGIADNEYTIDFWRKRLSDENFIEI